MIEDLIYFLIQEYVGHACLKFRTEIAALLLHLLGTLVLAISFLRLALYPALLLAFPLLSLLEVRSTKYIILLNPIFEPLPEVLEKHCAIGSSILGPDQRC